MMSHLAKGKSFIHCTRNLYIISNKSRFLLLNTLSQRRSELISSNLATLSSSRPVCGPVITSSHHTHSLTTRMGLASSLFPQPIDELIQDTISSNCVVIFSKTTCGFCRMAKQVFSEMGVPYTAIEVNDRQDGSKIQQMLGQMTGQTTMPRVFVNSECIGGGTETRNLYRQGTLLELVNKCKQQKAEAEQNKDS